MWTEDDLAVAAGHSVDPAAWLTGLDELMLQIGPHFARVEPRRRVRGFLLGLLAGLPRTNCWSVAEHAGESRPDGMQRLLASASWDAEAVQQDLRGYVVEHLGDPGGVLVVDETGDLKKGRATVGVQRQYTGTAGRIENSQVAVYLTYAGPRGYAFIDRALYLPKSWTEDPQRRTAAGVPQEVKFATKPALAQTMIGAALDAGVPASWITGDEVYGADPKLRKELVRRSVGFVLAIAKDHRITTGIGARRAIDLAVRLPKHAWQRISAGPGAKGERWYDWALIDTTDPAAQADPAGHAGHAAQADPAQGGEDLDGGTHWLLIRRNRGTGELAFYRAFSPRPVPLRELVRVAGTRWRIEESFQSGKELAGIDEHQVRRWTSWQRWTVLAMLAHAFLSVMTAAAQPHEDRDDQADRPAQEQSLIALTRNEIRRLLATFITPVRDPRHVLRWSIWRRRHQARARASHYARQAAQIA